MLHDMKLLPSDYPNQQNVSHSIATVLKPTPADMCFNVLHLEYVSYQKITTALWLRRCQVFYMFAKSLTT